MIFLSAFGFDIVELGPDDYDDIYSVLETELVRKKLNQTLVARDQRILSNNIKYTFKVNLYYAVGLKKGDELIGVCLCNDTDDMPWLGNLVIKEEYRKTKAFIVLAHFLLNMMFKDRSVSTGTEVSKDFEKLLIPPSKQIKVRVFDPRAGERLQKIIDKATA